MNPYDYIYRALKIHIQQLSEDSAEAQTLRQYVCCKYHVFVQVRSMVKQGSLRVTKSTTEYAAV